MDSGLVSDRGTRRGACVVMTRVVGKQDATVMSVESPLIEALVTARSQAMTLFGGIFSSEISEIRHCQTSSRLPRHGGPNATKFTLRRTFAGPCPRTWAVAMRSRHGTSSAGLYPGRSTSPQFTRQFTRQFVRASMVQGVIGVAASSLSSLHSSVSSSAALRFVPQADRRQLPDRRMKNWRGGRRVSDFTQFVHPAPLGAPPHDAHARHETGAESRLH